MNNKKLPWDELSGESNLDGTYKVTFLFNVKKKDGVTIGRLHEALAAGLAGDPVLSKSANLDLEKTDKDGNSLPEQKPFQVGDVVKVKENTEIQAELEYFHGYYIIGAKNLQVKKLGKTKVIIPKGFVAKINNISENKVELTDFDSAVSAQLEDSETGENRNIFVNLDNVIFENKDVEHVEDND